MILFLSHLLRTFSIPFRSVSTSQLYVFMIPVLLANCCHRESIIINTNTKYQMWSVIAKENYVMAWLPSAFAARTSRKAHSASIVRYHCSSSAFFIYQRSVFVPSSRFKQNALFLSSFSCLLIAVQLHCDAWCPHEVHSTLQPLCGTVRVRCCWIFVIALPWVRSKFEQLQCRPGTA